MSDVYCQPPHPATVYHDYRAPQKRDRKSMPDQKHGSKSTHATSLKHNFHVYCKTVCLCRKSPPFKKERLTLSVITNPLNDNKSTFQRKLLINERANLPTKSSNNGIILLVASMTIIGPAAAMIHKKNTNIFGSWILISTDDHGYVNEFLKQIRRIRLVMIRETTHIFAYGRWLWWLYATTIRDDEELSLVDDNDDKMTWLW